MLHPLISRKLNRLNKIILVFLILSCTAMLSASGKKDRINQTGVLVSYGNVPFTYAVFQTEEGLIYNIVCEGKLKHILNDSWGNRVRIKGYLIDRSEAAFEPYIMPAPDGYLKVQKIEIIEN